jgi:hypothetical protein
MATSSGQRFYPRWSVPVIPTLVLALTLLLSNDLSLNVESLKGGLGLLGSAALWSGLAWWITLDSNRCDRYVRRVSLAPVLTLLLLIGSLIAILDIGLDLVELPRLLTPLIVVLTVIQWALSTVNPVENLRRLAMLAIAPLIALAICELVFLWFLADHKTPVTEDEFDKWVASKWPRPIPTEKPPGTFRIMGLSDSFGWVGDHENYHYLLESILRDRGFDVDVVNLSVGEFEPSDEYELLRRFGARYDPDLILHGFFVGNDFDTHRGVLRSFRFLSIRPYEDMGGLRPRNFAFLHWFSRTKKLERNIKLVNQEELAGLPAGRYTHEFFLDIERRRMSVCRTSLRVRDRWQPTLDILDSIREETSNMNARYVMVIHPDQFQIEDDLLQELFTTFDYDREAFDLGLPQRFLSAYCDREEIPYVDLLPPFRARGSGGGLYLLRDTHYNLDGQELAAKEIADSLVGQNLLQEPK